MQVNDHLVNQMLRNLPRDQREIMTGILKNDITHEVICNSQDQYEETEVRDNNEDGSPRFYKSGEKKGEMKMKTEKRLVRRGVNGRVIAHITSDGQVLPVPDEDGFIFLRSSRKRTDGEYGFESWCGTDSRIAPNEKGIMTDNGIPPSQADLFKMATNLEQNPPKYATINGEREVDGFIIREVRK